jgi:hypothetical protein
VKKSGSLVKYDEQYVLFLSQIKEKIKKAQLKAALSVNRHLIELYWETGRGIVERQKTENWGDAVIESLAKDLQNTFPGIRGLSRSKHLVVVGFYGLGIFSLFAWQEIRNTVAEI